mmetsp:Transcript_17451/g.41737  ORF Transcript_17451/g.41737 Transcript_17451/m.41737 type:complete len:183 (-) Transcript_17451:622-1170(-)
MQLFKLVTFGIFWKLGSTSDDFMVMGVAVFNTTVAGKQDIYNNSNALASTAIEDSLQFAQMNPLDNGGCAAIELPLSPTGECLPNPSLPSWCLPVFKQLNGIDLLLEGAAYMQSIASNNRHQYMVMMFKNMTSHRSPSFERTHWLHNKRNQLGLSVYSRNFKIWLIVRSLKKAPRSRGRVSQ